MRSIARCLTLCAALAGFGHASSAFAQVDARALVRALTNPQPIDEAGKPSGPARRRAQVPPAFRLPGSSRLSLLVRLPTSADARAFGLRPIAPGLAALEATPSELAALSPELRPVWSPPLRVALDQASSWTRAAAFRAHTSSGGQGAVVGVVDTGVDVAHPDFRHPDGTTRIAWLIDFSRDAEGLHRDLENEYGCTSGVEFKCAIYSADDIDALIASSSSLDEPRDTFGHGTHVTSLAAGNGLGSGSARYVGIAPEATLIVARAARGAGGELQDADVLLATRFIYERAAEMRLPAVVNLSLGTDFGAHDGSSSLEQALADFVGAEHPGRVMVVAAGNRATLYVEQTDEYPEPLGIHTEVHVPRNSSLRVPLLTPPPPTGLPVTNATLYVWIGARPGDELAVGVDNADGRWIDPVEPGNETTYQDDDLEVTILNGTGSEGGSEVQGSNAVVVIDGSWQSGATFAIRLEGHGTASLWVQSEGNLGPATGSMGAVFPRGMKQGTINVPASHPELIAVGATLNRTTWTDHEGNEVQVSELGGLVDPPADSATYFSSAGPTATGVMKPDLVAPGAFLVGAMSSLANPTRNGQHSVFASGPPCEPDVECFVVDATHAISTGTSMAAPLVSGAAALLLACDPSLTQNEVRALLQAGARRPRGEVPVEQQVGPGSLDIDRALEVQLIMDSGFCGVEEGSGASAVAEPSPQRSWLALANDYAHPDPEWVLRGVVQLRTGSGGIAHGFSATRLRLIATPARIVEPLQQAAPGLWRFGVAAPAGTGGQSLQLRVVYDDRTLVRREVPIAVDRWVAEEGVEARGGCSIGQAQRRRNAGVSAAWLLALLALRRRRARA